MTRMSCSANSHYVDPDGRIGKQLTATDGGLERRQIDFPKLSPRVGDCWLQATDYDVGSDDTVVRDKRIVIDGNICDQR